MARKRKVTDLTAGELNLTAMIDVAFQLLSFFIITMVPVDVLANLEANRPRPPDKTEITRPPVLTPVRVTILPDGKFSFNDIIISKDNLDRTLCDLGKLNCQYNILLVCTPKSTHEKMVEALDMCSKAGLSNLSIVSTL
ncbi:MAG TPA: hypothetical protein DCZ94_11235 [Lentisphaeria bacterium]|nr:hypothetical protein [Lentisphaeria bacterium]